MGPPRQARKKPVVASDSDDDVQRSPPPKRPKRGTLLSTANGARDDATPRARTRRVPSPKPPAPLPAPSPKKSPAKSPRKPKPIYKPITSFFTNVPRTAVSQPTPSPEKSTASTPAPVDDIHDSSDDDLPAKQPAALPVRKARGPLVANSNPKPSQRFLHHVNAVRAPQSQPLAVDAAGRRPWNERYGPASLDELAVHKKKVADVRAWLSAVFSGKERKRLLLLKGPAGSGKTTTMSLLARDLGFHIHEWKNPTSSLPSSEGFVSATAQFEDFVGRTGAFGSLDFDEPAPGPSQRPTPAQTGGQKQVILVEEFPNTFARTSSVVQSFRSSLLHYLAANTPSATAFFSAKPAPEQSVTPIVMIISETLLSTNTAAADSFTAHRLLGPEILTHPGVSVIEFNPIAPTFMVKALELVVLKEARKSGRRKTVGPQVIQRLSELGDIRSAVSSLEFLCLRGDETEGWGAKVNFSKKKGSKDIPMTQMEQESLEMVTQRESTLGIFHAVGRVVYNKRSLEDPSKPVPQPPHWLPDRRRPKASEVNVDALIDELGTDTQTFIAALHENYVLSSDAGDSEETLDCINGCIDALSDADLLSPDRFGASGFGRRSFQGTSADHLRQDEMSFQTSVRGLLFSLPHPVKRISPPPGIMGTKAKGVGAGGGSASKGSASKGSAFVMYYPTSLRLWRQQEEVGGLLEIWVSRAQQGQLFGPTSGSAKPSNVAGGVDTWKKAAQSAQLSHPKQSSQDDDTSPVLLGSGGSARYEMLLERLPYLPTILRRASTSSSAHSASIREIQKITAFTGRGASASNPDDDDPPEPDDAPEHEQWATDKPGADTPRRKKRVAFAKQGKEADMESAFPGGTRKEGMSAVLSDDDIED